MKKYFKPTVECYIVHTQSLLIDMSEGAADPDYEKGGDAKRRRRNNDWEMDDEWEDDQNVDGVLF